MALVKHRRGKGRRDSQRRSGADTPATARDNGGMTLGIRDVAADAILLAGGGHALLLQLAAPGVAHGVARHSDFAERPLDRLNGTLTYLTVTVFGTPDEARAVARDVGRAHAPVEGANDTALQVWVAATLYESAMRARELVHPPLGGEDAEALLAEFAVVATALGVPRASWPASRAEFAEYWSSAALDVGDEARDVARALLHPRRGPLWLRALMPTVRLVTAGLLDPGLRAAYGLELDERRYARLVRVLRAVYPRLPLAVRTAPMRRYLRSFRRLAR